MVYSGCQLVFSAFRLIIRASVYQNPQGVLAWDRLKV